MRKIFITITIVFITIIILILYINMYKTPNTKYYSISRSYSYYYADDKRMSFDIYITENNNFIKDTAINSYYLENDDYTFKLNNLDVTVDYASKNNGEIFYCYNLTCNIIQVTNDYLKMDNCFLIIKNEKLVLKQKIGYVEIIPSIYEPLKFYDLYGNYSYIDNELYMVGITICLDSSYRYLYEVNLGKASGNNLYIKKDTLYDSQISYNTLESDLIGKVKDMPAYYLNSQNGYYFIPLIYEDLYLIKNTAVMFKIDSKYYYIEDFYYLLNDISIFDYEKSKLQGEIVYA